MFAHATEALAPSLFDRLNLVVLRFRAALAGAAEANRVYRELASLSSAQMAARGLVRDDIARMTLQSLKHASSC